MRTKPITLSETYLVFNVGGLYPRQDGDSIELFSPGANAFGSPSFSDLMPGATSTTNEPYDASDMYETNLIEGDKGDTVYVTQLVTLDHDVRRGGRPANAVGTQGPGFDSASG